MVDGCNLKAPFSFGIFESSSEVVLVTSGTHLMEGGGRRGARPVVIMSVRLND